MKHYLLSLFVLASAAFAADNLAHEKLSPEEKKAKAAIEEFFEKCATYPSFALRIEVSKHNLTNTDLVKEAKKKVKHALPASPALTDDEIFPHGGDGGFATADFESPNFDEARTKWCAARIGRLNSQYDIQGVVGSKNERSMLGYVLQRRMGDHATLFYAVSEPYFDFAALEELSIEVGNDDKKPGIDEYESLQIYKTFETDGALREYLINDDGSLGKFSRQQLAVARALLINWSAAGEDIKAGKYLKENATWTLSKVKSPTTGEILTAVHFSEYDDNSYTVFFYPKSAKLAYVYYEN